MKRIVLMALLLVNIIYAQEMPRASLVEVKPVKSGNINPLQSYVGTLYYDRKSALASEEEGLIVKRLTDDGQYVKKGEVIFILDSRILKSDIASQEASLEALNADFMRDKLDLERSKTLYERKSISKKSYENTLYGIDNLKARINALKENIKGLRIRLEKRTIKAPFDAVVLKRYKEIGEWIGRGNTLVELADTSSIEVHVNVQSKLMASLKIGQDIITNIDGNEIESKIKTIIPIAQKATRTFPVELSIKENHNFIEGMRADVKFPAIKKQDALLVPRDAVIKRFEQDVIFLANDGIALMLPVKIIGFNGSECAVSAEGLQAGASVITKGNERIFPNMPIKVIK